MKLLLKAITIASTIIAAPAFAANWTLNSDASHLAYGTVKIDDVGEVNSFTNLSGHVRDDGHVKIDIDLSSVETNIDIRNERMIEHVFRKAATATLTANIDMDAVSKLKVGESSVVEVDATLSLVGTDVEFYTDMYILRLAEDSVMVSTNDMVFISTEDAGVSAGVDKLMELAQLPGITRTVPVTARLMFSLDG
ncbi:YceI family protein [Ruegeria sp.]|uniref:YceI family protein n=1 Tax=Ruegeria sp. TaxID=1879320 RepID=UPI00231E8764|nr:YceI family protein [Ruegeria sp.]MDA7964028.1 YceI family protein [Ruegeria sp.]